MQDFHVSLYLKLSFFLFKLTTNHKETVSGLVRLNTVLVSHGLKSHM